MIRICTYPNDVLHRQCENVVVFDAALKRLVNDMLEEMYVLHGVGIAAPQVGVLRNIIAVDPSAGEQADKLIVMINPKITSLSDDKLSDEEGCLSFPGMRLHIIRSTQINVEYSDVNGETFSWEPTGLNARIVQHEIDHLNGLTLLDRVGPLTRKLALKNYFPYG